MALLKAMGARSAPLGTPERCEQVPLSKREDTARHLSAPRHVSAPLGTPAPARPVNIYYILIVCVCVCVCVSRPLSRVPFRSFNKNRRRPGICKALVLITATRS